MFSRYVVSQVKHNSWFLVGMVLGLWLALSAVPLDEAPTCAAPLPPAPDDFEPQREERPDRAAAVPGRSIQRPRYYSTELGMRAPLLAGVLVGAAPSSDRLSALNSTARALQPALKFFITAGTRQAAGGLANVVGFTDTREMLKPFHALKYLADNFLDEYNFFFLVSDAAYINARRLTELVSRLSVSQDVYMGTVAEDDSHYCSLDSGIILSNSVLRALHAELDWCVRNSYSPHHHENIGRCVLHAAHQSCTPQLQGESYVSARLEDPPRLTPALGDAVTAHPVQDASLLLRLHAYTARVRLERAHSHTRELRAAVRRGARRHPPGFRNATWPGGLRGDPGLSPPPPDSRFDLARWTALNLTHAFMPSDLVSVAPLETTHKRALHAVLEQAIAWARRRWGVSEATLVEGAMRWEPATALRYRLLLRLTGEQAGDKQGGATLRQIEVVRPLGTARLAPVPYVTESGRLTLVLPAPVSDLGTVRGFLVRYEAVCLQKDRNTNLLVVLLTESNTESPEATELRSAAATLASKYRAAVDVIGVAAPAQATPPTPARAAAAAARRAMDAALPRLSRDALVVLCDARMEFNEDFLNRARMNSIPGTQWFLPQPFARFHTHAHPRVVAPDGSRPQHHTGRFSGRQAVAAFCRADYAHALAEWTANGGSSDTSVPEVLSHGPTRCLRAPEPGLVLQPSPQPCRANEERLACLASIRDADGFDDLELGARHALAKLLLEEQAERER